MNSSNDEVYTILQELNWTLVLSYPAPMLSVSEGWVQELEITPSGQYFIISSGSTKPAPKSVH